MPLKVCLCANTLSYPEGGGHLWVYLNWALGLRTLNVEVIWLEQVDVDTPPREIQANLAALKEKLLRYGLGRCIALWPPPQQMLPAGASVECISIEQAVQADLLLNLAYDLPPKLVERFRRSALLDIDPGLTQVWVSRGNLSLAKHDVYFTIGETVGKPRARIPNLGLKWEYTPPCVALDWWPAREAAPGASFTTVSQWWATDGDGLWEEDHGEIYANDKRSGFVPFLELPLHTRKPLELALCLEKDDEELGGLRKRGWRVRDAQELAATPWDYQRYIQNSLGEFSCAKPSCLRFQNAWISDRTLCYLASGKPCVVQHTGSSLFLPDCCGLFRFRTMEEAVSFLDRAMSDYERQGREARALAKEYFDAEKVARGVLERALD